MPTSQINSDVDCDHDVEKLCIAHQISSLHIFWCDMHILYNRSVHSILATTCIQDLELCRLIWHKLVSLLASSINVMVHY